MATNEHSKIINKVAKQKLSPLGIVQKGSSRLWFDDRGWFSTVIEFQPSAWARGSYLNVGVNFHWYEQDFFSFDIGYREQPFSKYGNDELFADKINEFCDIAVEKALYFRDALSTLRSAKDIILNNHQFSADEFWGNYHRGTICGLTGDCDLAAKYYTTLFETLHPLQKQDPPKPVKWVDDLKNATRGLLVQAGNPAAFRTEVTRIVANTRKLKKLPDADIVFNEA
jgi:hypothetical protein